MKIFLLFFVLSQLITTLFAESEALALLKQPGHVALVRHALAPGVGDPASFDLKDCSTQRTLSEQGREQSRRMGQLLKEQGIEKARIYSSQWCRCLETGRLLGLGEVTELPAINSFFRNPEQEAAQMKALRKWLEVPGEEKNGPRILITHQVVITSLTGIFPESGEILILKQGEENQGWQVLERVKTL